jgi:uncharacterized protein (TIGR02679 family)
VIDPMAREADGKGRRRSLEDPALAGVWEGVRRRLERTDTASGGRLRLPELTSRARFLLGSLLGRTVTATVSLGDLERALVALGVGDDLSSAVAALGYPPSSEPARRRAVRRAGADARLAARREVETWDEDWASTWVDAVIRAGILAGLDEFQAVDLLRRARAVVQRIAEGLDASDRLSRVDLAASVLGSAHALDWGSPEEAAVTRALGQRFDVAGRDAWRVAGVDLDLVSAPALTWNLAPVLGSPLAAWLGEARRLQMPVHLSQLALRAHPLVVAPGADVLVTENPRIVEAAAQAHSPLTVISLNGNPSGAARLLVGQLLECGAALRYHGDFDAAGLRICARMHRLGLRPYRMDRAAYEAALAEADDQGLRLPVDAHPAPPTPWDPGLQAAFDRDRRVVHEERLLDSLLDADGFDRRSRRPG